VIARRIYYAIDLMIFFLIELTASSMRVAWEVMTPRKHRTPGIIEVSLDVKTDRLITALALLITLTPGSLSLDVSTDRRSLYVHSMFAADPELVRDNVKQGFERRIMRLFG
jgi:multicomponent Na+:H+ antiporter subunit E